MSETLGRSFRETLLKSDLLSVVQTAGEIGYDSFLDDGLLKNIPVLSWMLAIGKTFGSVRDYLFAKKMIAFLQSISSLSEEERQHLIHRLDADEKFGKYAGEQIIELLSRIDSERKAVLAASALKLYARKKITSYQLERVNNAIDRFLLTDTDEFRSFCSDSDSDSDSDADTRKKGKIIDANPVTANLINAGLGYVSSGWGGGGILHPTETAHLFLQVIEEAGQ